MTCCRLPAADILRDEIGYYQQSCPNGSVLTGSSLYCTDEQRLHYFFGEQEELCAKMFQCTQINTDRYQLGPPTQGIFWGASSTYWQWSRRFTLKDIPAALRYGIGRSSKYTWENQGCIGLPFGSLLVALSGTWCTGDRFRQLQYRGLDGDPPQGSPVEMYPRCDTILDLFDPDARCLSAAAPDTLAASGHSAPRGSGLDEMPVPESTKPLAELLAALAAQMGSSGGASPPDLLQLTRMRDHAVAAGDTLQAAELNEQLRRASNFFSLLAAAEIHHALDRQVAAVESLLLAFDTGFRNDSLTNVAALVLFEFRYDFDPFTLEGVIKRLSKSSQRSLAILGIASQLHRARGNHAEAVVILKRLVEAGTNDLHTDFTLAWHTLQSGKRDEALRLYEEALTRWPHEEDSYAYFVGGLAAADRCKRAEAVATQGLARVPARTSWWYAVGACYLRNELPDDAFRVFTQTIAFDDSSSESYFHLGQIEEQRGNYQQAIEHYRSAVANDTKGGTYLYYPLYSLYVTRGLGGEALALLQSMAKKYPDSVDAHALVAQAYGMHNREADERRHFEHAAAIKGQTALSLYLLARYHAEQGDKDRALEYLQQLGAHPDGKDRYIALSREIFPQPDASNGAAR